MKQSTRIIIAGVVLILLIAGGIAAIKLAPRGENNEILSPKVMIELEAEQLAHIDVTNDDGSFSIELEDGQLTGVKGYEGAPLNADVVSRIAAVCKILYAYDTIEKNCEDLSTYGLNKPEAEAVVTDTDGSEYAVSIGRPTPSATAHYVAFKGSNDVYAVDDDYLQVYFMTGLNFISKQITKLPEPDTEYLVDDFTLTKGGETVFAFNVYTDAEKEFINSSGLFKVTVPFVAVGRDANLISYLNNACNFSASSVKAVGITDELLKKYDLDDPEYVMTYHYAGQETVIYMSKVDSGFANAYVKGGDIIYTFVAQKLYLLSFDSLLYANPNQFTRDVNEVSRIIIDLDGADYVYSVERSGNKFTITHDGAAVDTDLFMKFYTVLTSSRITGLAEKPEGAEPYLSFTFKYADSVNKPNDAVDFYRINDREYFLEINGAGSFYCSSLFIDKVADSIEKLNAGESFDPAW